MEVAKAEVGGGAVASKGVEVSAANQNNLGDSEGGGASGQSANVVSFCYVVHHYVALDAHFCLCLFL